MMTQPVAEWVKLRVQKQLATKVQQAKDAEIAAKCTCGIIEPCECVVGHLGVSKQDVYDYK